MNPLERLKEQLKVKPITKPQEAIKIIIAPQQDTPKTIITAKRDEGQRAQEILDKIKQKQLTGVIQKFPKPIEELPVSKAPIIPDKTKPKIKKLKQLSVIQEDTEPEEVQPDEQQQQKQIDTKFDIINYEEEIVPAPKPPRKRISKPIQRNIIPLGQIQIGDTPLPKRLPPLPIYNMKVSSYYMNNREIFVNFINGLFEPYKQDLLDETKGISCEDIGKDTGEVSLLTHQKIVRDYINLYTPYRGLLLYHGLGSGKTCSSIAIAEGMKSAKKIYVLTPASLRRNYIEEIKKCGDLLFRKNQYWEWISIHDNPELLGVLQQSLGLEASYIQRHGGAWLVNVTKPNNYSQLSTNDKKTLNDQLDEMIRNKYTFINYNGLRRDRFKQMTKDFSDNIFDNSVVIIDEAHNLISRIVNKINSIPKYSKQPKGQDIIPLSLSLILYEFLLKAENCRIILLTGTPIINYPNEIGILFNILRGYIKTWQFNLNTETNNKVSKEILQTIFEKEKLLDYMDYIPSSKTLTITRNPFGFENKIVTSGYKGVTNEKKEKRNENGEVIKDVEGNILYEERGALTDAEFIKRIVKILNKNDINATPTTFTVNTALPDTLDEFILTFINNTNIDSSNVVNIDKFKRRILGLTSYFRSAQEELLPRYDRNFDRHEVLVPMSEYQFLKYETYRQRERSMDQPKKKKPIVDADGLFKEPSSTYRIFSRLACNFVMPTPPGRPIPYDMLNFNKQEATEDLNKEKEKEKEKEQKTDIKNKITKEKEKEAKAIEKAAKERTKAEEKEAKERIKAEEKAAKEEEKAEKERLKALEKEAKALEKERLKAIEKEAKEKAKAEEKAAKEKAKAEEKAAKEKLKAEEKAEKERLKAEAKANKKKQNIDQEGGDEEDEEETTEDEEETTEDEEETTEDEEDDEEKEDETSDDEEEEDKTSDDEEDKKKFYGGANLLEDFMKKIDTENIVISDIKDEDAKLREADELEGDEILEKIGDSSYLEAIQEAMRYLKLNKNKLLTPEGLETYSPKFLAILENIESPEHKGLHLVYSQFRTIEGIGIFALTLEANGFAQFKIKKTSVNTWEINMSEEELGKPCYALYTGTEEADEREIIRNIYNGSWDNIPNNIAIQLRARSSNNNMGEIIKVLMITSSGSEGINLRNTRYVHIMEPYWHPVRTEQVIGRARRICSHQALPYELQTVEVFMYIMIFTEAQLNSENAKELKLKDTSKIPPYLPETSDQTLFRISSIKENLTVQLLKAIKETSIDCAIHSKSSAKEGLACITFGKPNVNDWTYNPNIAQDQNDTIAEINKVVIDWEARPFTLKSTGKKYILRLDTNQVYDYESIEMAKKIPGVRPILLGKLIKNKKGEYEIIAERV